jgi:hypothetical protein
MNNKDKQAIAFKFLIDKMLKPYGESMSSVLQNHDVKYVPWTQRHVWTIEEKLKFKRESVAYLKQVFRWSNIDCEKVMNYFLVQYGLKTKDDENVSAD